MNEARKTQGRVGSGIRKGADDQRGADRPSSYQRYVGNKRLGSISSLFEKYD